MDSTEVYSSDKEIEEFIQAWEETILCYIRHHRVELFRTALNWYRNGGPLSGVLGRLEVYCKRIGGQDGWEDIALIYISEVAIEDSLKGVLEG
ncbi:hypothetical protein HNP46_004316 [Pseudomonas nitritireducens]|uniref:Uncharacterized protein n=1 Tax=Pseudomonas nitroreducens TaxID=46680 RepID=A0A7W7KM96_PSENT|nr:hypothetical protein [Pseudomonas nitritireducens]MBB4865435.1 hypothetical protein [Pseudomonas nitritireducens]